MYGLSNGENIFAPQWMWNILKSQGTNLENFEVEYLKNGTR